MYVFGLQGVGRTRSRTTGTMGKVVKRHNLHPKNVNKKKIKKGDS